MEARYVCDRCGVCCAAIVEVDHLDVLREPQIAQKCKLLDGNGRLKLADAQWSVACGTTLPCPFAGRDAQNLHTCAIYHTRPNVCVSFQAGSPACQRWRSSAGLPALEPVAMDTTVLTEIKELFRTLQVEEDD